MSVSDNIDGVDKVIEILGRWNPGDLAFICTINWDEQGTDGYSQLNLTTIFQKSIDGLHEWPSNESPWYRVDICFLGVSKLLIQDLGPGCFQVMGFDIVNIAKSSWEGKSFQIIDYEDEKISFYCESIRIKNVVQIYHFKIP